MVWTGTTDLGDIWKTFYQVVVSALRKLGLLT